MLRHLKTAALLIESMSFYVFVGGMVSVSLFLETDGVALSQVLGDAIGYLAGAGIVLIMLVAFQSITGVRIHKEKSALHHTLKTFEPAEPVGLHRILLGLAGAAFAPLIIWMFWSKYQNGEAPLIAFAIPLAGLLAHWVFGPFRSLGARHRHKPAPDSSRSDGPDQAGR